ncbi:hypothetical protein ACVBEQ_08015 [Nakamurella sp. GG22]
MRIETVIAIRAQDAVGPTRLELLTAGSVKLPVVVIVGAAPQCQYHVFDVASLQSAFVGALSGTTVAEVLDLAGREPQHAVQKSAAATAAPGTPVEDNGRLIGVIAPEPPERSEPSEADMERGAAESAPAKKGLWQRLTGSG